MRNRLLLAIALIALAGCGRRENLTIAPGQTWPVKPAMAASVPTVEQLLAPPIQARPGRSDEVLLKSQERPDDRFELPPPG